MSDIMLELKGLGLRISSLEMTTASIKTHFEETRLDLGSLDERLNQTENMAAGAAVLAKETKQELRLEIQ